LDINEINCILPYTLLDGLDPLLTYNALSIDEKTIIIISNRMHDCSLVPEIIVQEPSQELLFLQQIFVKFSFLFVKFRTSNPLADEVGQSQIFQHF